MPVRDPHHRARAIREALENDVVPTDAKMRAVYEAVNGTKPNDALVYAWEKYETVLERTIIEAFLLADAPLDEVAHITEMPIAVLQAYRDTIFDMHVFRDRLERISYVNYKRGLLTATQQSYLESALLRGWRYIAWMINHQAVSELPKRILEIAAVEGLYMGLGHRGTDPGSERAKQAKAWLQSGVQAATTLMRLDPADDTEAKNELRVALLGHDSVDSAETAGAPAPADIIH